MSESDVRETDHVPAHKDFREKYFKGFRRNADEGEHVVLEEMGPTSGQEKSEGGDK